MSREVKSGKLELIACDCCGSHFATDDGPGMIEAIVGPCPDCGGRFQLVDSLPDGAVSGRNPLRARRGSAPAATSPADPRRGRSA